MIDRGFPGDSLVKNLPTKTQEIQVRSLSGDNPLEKERATHSSILAWDIQWTEEPGGLQTMQLQRVRHDWTWTPACITHINKNSLESFIIFKDLKCSKRNWRTSTVQQILTTGQFLLLPWAKELHAYLIRFLSYPCKDCNSNLIFCLTFNFVFTLQYWQNIELISHWSFFEKCLSWICFHFT